MARSIGITPENELVFGERRLAACRDVLAWERIDVRVVDVSSIAAGEFAENEMRKDFTPSERVAILETIERKKNGGNKRLEQSQNIASAPDAAKAAGFGNKETARQATLVTKKGVPALAQDHVEEDEPCRAGDGKHRIIRPAERPDDAGSA